MLKIILNRLKPQAEKIIAEEQAGLKAGRSTTEILNLRILCEKYLQHQQDLYQVFIDPSLHLTKGVYLEINPITAPGCMQIAVLHCAPCHIYGVVPKELLTFLGFLANEEFSPYHRTPEVIKKVCGCFCDSQ